MFTITTSTFMSLKVLSNFVDMEDSIRKLKSSSVSRSRSPSRKRSHSSSSSTSPEPKSKKKYKKTRERTSSSCSSTEEEYKKKKRKKHKKKSKKLKKEKRKEKKCKKDKKEKESNDVPISLMDRAKAMAPMTKEEWEKKQSVVRRVFDEETGRHRLIKGDGEVLEEIVSRDRHKEINRQATLGDGNFFQSKINSSIKK